MSNSLITCNIVAKEALAILQNMLGFAANVNTDWQDEFSGNMSRGYAPGTTINIKKPPRYTYRAGRVAIPQVTTETTIPLTLSQGGCDLNFTGLEKTLLLKQFENKMQAAVAAVCNEIDRQGLDMARVNTANAVGTPGTFPTTTATALAAITQVNQKLDENAAPRDKQRALILNPAMNASLIQGFAGLFNNQATLGTQYAKGMMVDSLGLAYAMDQNVTTHVNGAATPTNVNGAGQIGNALSIVALAGGTLTRGSVITLPGVTAVNPQSRISTGSPQQFVITADALVGATTLNIFPPLIVSGPFQNVTGSPTTGAAFTILGAPSSSYGCNIGYHRDAFTLAMVPMAEPATGTGAKVSQMTDNGMTVKVTQFYDGVQDNNIMRLDVLFGWAATYPELACKLVA